VRKKPPAGGGGGSRTYADHRGHAEAVREQIDAALATRNLERPGKVDPRAILLIKLNRPVNDGVWDAVDLVEFDGRNLEATVAFSTRVDLSAFLERLAKYRAAAPSENGSLVGADLFDRIDTVRFYGPEDRISPRLAEAIAAMTPASGVLDVDVELWHPGGKDDADEAQAWTLIVRDSVEAGNGTVVDWYTNHDVGVLLLRVRLDVAGLTDLATLDEIATMDLKATAPAVLDGVVDLTVHDLPPMLPPAADAPLLGVIDSGVSGAHRLIGPALYEATTLLPGLADGADGIGHGTAVAGVALHGPAEEWLQAGALAPFARLLSIRVLNANNEFPDAQLWVNALLEAVEHAADRGCRIINISIGDRDGAMVDRRATHAAALLDQVARERGLVLIVPTGNVEDPREYVPEGPNARADYVRAALASDATTLLDPAPAALALTVGGLGADGSLKLGEYPLGIADAPSANTRRGPGIARAIKPELSAPAGTMSTSDDLGFRDRNPLKLVVLSHAPDELFTRAKGTSFAAPVVARVATAVQAQYPGASSPLIRALVLQASAVTAFDEALLPTGTKTERLRSRVHMLGHGTPTVNGARFSRRDRVVLVAEGTLEVDKIILYEFPLPESFLETGGLRTIDLAVCFDPLTRYRRKDYIGSRLFPYVFLGQTVESIKAVLAEADIEDLEREGEDEGELEGQPASGTLASLNPLTFRPSTAMSSDSANILMRWKRHQRLDPALPPLAHLAIRSSSRWSPPGTEDPFAVALALGHNRTDVDLHAELRARIEIELDVEVELDA
jgi:subtilisin family serine protease